MNTRADQIENFCRDLRIIWSKYCQELSFGRLISAINNNDLKHITDAEVIDRLLDFCEEE